MAKLVVGLLAMLGCGFVALQVEASGSYSVPLFVFGSSFADSGNNNYLDTSIRADSPPYGIDSPDGRPTGRFSNYRNLADYLSIALGLPGSPLPFLDPRLYGETLLRGCNFASAGVGISNDTGLQRGNIITFPEQLQAFEQYRARLASEVGGREQAQRLVNQGVAYVSIAASDFVDNYFARPFSARASQYTRSEYVDYLIDELAKILLRLYELGMRRTVVVGVGPFGCWPAQLAISGRTDGECDPELQGVASLFNAQLTRMTQRLNDQLGGVYFIAVNTFTLGNELLNNPGAFGFTETKVACCGQGPYNGVGQCTPASNLCPNRDEYIYWDSSNPTDRASAFFAESVFNGPASVIFPVNLQTMLAMGNES